ncbi:2-hydroxymuconate tautomerase [Fictibacillus enclensis]|uniref:2-hydroxymuconate tautomerase n=1 Tax=Fictibacillus enclensis TaxID=1017270 RepID=UPI0025A09387|nr:2-hydroxymuconate tautomerase [Fictibacillus enclensis]MDM5196703.1 2-hydroxymuconate tautomerase [Fictibacillus enclensis]
MPFIRIDLLEGRSEELKRKLITEVTDAAEKVLSAPRENIRVVLTEVPKQYWAVGGIPMSER